VSSTIPLGRPLVVGTELDYIARAIASGRLAGDGEFTRACARLLESRLGTGRVLMTPSCTAALELAAIVCGLGPGDEVIMPSFTFVSTALAVVRVGARPVFVDIRPDTLNLDEDLIEPALTSRTRAIMPVHYAGVGCEMDRIMAIARSRGLLVIEDAAQAVGASYRGLPLGSIGDLGAFSFHETKNLTCGEGGALSVNDPSLVGRAEIVRDKGTNRGQFMRGEVDQYTWIDVGSSYLLGELCSAYLLAQLEAMDEVQRRRWAIEQTYDTLLAPLERRGMLRTPLPPPECSGNAHVYYVLLEDEPTRDSVMATLRRDGIGVAFHFVPLHTSPRGQALGYRPGDLPVTEQMSRRLLRLPNFVGIMEEDQARVVNRLAAALDRRLGAPPPLVTTAALDAGGHDEFLA
jgi:dTDP-4-amino-4,6-dideoxygalactose transaminase